MKVFSGDYLRALSTQAKCNPRRRQHRNIHESYQEVCQRLFNAIEPESYIRHRHTCDTRDELLMAVRGLMVLVIFDEQGDLLRTIRFGDGRYIEDAAVGVEVPADTWHTVIALESDCVLLEIKAGPFDPNQSKDLAPWAPEEGCPTAEIYLQKLKSVVKQR